MWIYSHSMQVTIKAKSLCGLSVRSPRSLRSCVRGWAVVAVTVLTCTEVCDIDCGHPLSVHCTTHKTHSSDSLLSTNLVWCNVHSTCTWRPLMQLCTCLCSKGLCWWWSSLLTRSRDRPWTISRHADSCFSASQLRRRFQLGTCNKKMNTGIFASLCQAVHHIEKWLNDVKIFDLRRSVNIYRKCKSYWIGFTLTLEKKGEKIYRRVCVLQSWHITLVTLQWAEHSWNQFLILHNIEEVFDDSLSNELQPDESC